MEHGRPDEKTLLSVRTAVIFLLAALCGLGAGVLGALAGSHPAEAVFAGVGAAAAATAFFHWLIA